MPYMNISSGFSVGGDTFIDERLLLTKEQMKGAYDEWFMPPVYICYCLDDKQWYEYNENNEEDPETGFYRPIPSGIVKDVRIEGVSILDSEGIADFEFPVEDVLVDGVSVVENKKAQIDLTDLQKKLIPGEGIAISDSNVISATVLPLEGEGIKVDSEGHISIDKEVVPVKDELEELVEDLGFVTAQNLNNVLNNYYTNSETYNKTEVNDLISQIAGGVTMEVVAVLPITGEPSTIYLVRRSIDSPVYDQYIWFNNAWVQVGSTEVDLTQYYTKTETDNLLLNKQDKLVQGQGITITGNVISANVTDLPEATSSRLGVVKYDNDTIKKNDEGQLYAVGGGGEGTKYYEGENIYFTRSSGKDYINAESYTAGPGITITSGKQIKAKVDDVTIHTNTTTGELYMDAVPIDAGNGIKIQNGTISIEPTGAAKALELSNYQQRMKPGSGIQFVNGTDAQGPYTQINNVGGGGGGGANWGDLGGSPTDSQPLMDLFDDKADKTAVPTRVSQLTNDAGYITGITTDDLYNHLERGANIALDKIDNKVRITSQGGSGPSEVNWSDIVGKPAAINNIDAELADAKRKPTLPRNSYMFKANGNMVGGYNIAQSGSTYAGITIQRNGASVAPSVSSNNATYNIKVPTFTLNGTVLTITNN